MKIIVPPTGLLSDWRGITKRNTNVTEYRSEAKQFEIRITLYYKKILVFELSYDGGN